MSKTGYTNRDLREEAPASLFSKCVVEYQQLSDGITTAGSGSKQLTVAA